MNTLVQIDTWIYWKAIVHALILITCVAGILILKVLGQPMSVLLMALATVAGGGLPQVLTSLIKSRGN